MGKKNSKNNIKLPVEMYEVPALVIGETSTGHLQKVTFAGNVHGLN